MTPLPVEKRQTHAPVSSFDFNVKSKNVKEKMQNNKGICENTANTETGNSHTILISPIGFLKRTEIKSNLSKKIHALFVPKAGAIQGGHVATACLN